MREPSFGSKIILVVAALALVAIACTQPQSPAGTHGQGSTVTSTGAYTPPKAFDPSASLQPRSFASEDEFSAFVKEHAQGSGSVGAEAYGGAMLADRGAVNSAAQAPVPAVAKDASGSGSAGAPGFSGTNNQVAGVDEADTTKTDGSYIYTITGSTVFIVKAYPGEDAQVVSRIELNGTQPQGLFVDGDRLAVFGSFSDLDYFRAHDMRPRNGVTSFTIYDISDREHPTQVKDYKLEGSYFDARMKEGDEGGYAYLVLTSGLDDRATPMPFILEDGAERSVPVSDIMYYPIPYSNAQLVTVHAIALHGSGEDGKDLASKTITVEGSQTLYMSADNIYIAGTQWINQWQVRQDVLREVLAPKLTQSDKDHIAKIEAADPDVLSQQEKQAKIDQVYSDYYPYVPSDERTALDTQIDAQVKERLDAYGALEYTVIHKLSVSGVGVEVGPTGKVPGSLSNQFAMDESDGTLRVATTLSAQWWGGDIVPLKAEPAVMDSAQGGAPAVATQTVSSGSATVPVAGVAYGSATTDAKIVAPRPGGQSQPTNNVYALDAGMSVVGKLEGIAPGETIMSTRFIGDRLYMVTFRQVDPFFVIDLSDPKDIKALGTLKVPGFSRYLHPYDEHTVIGIGRDATATGGQQGLKISLFDVSDVAHPKELAKFVADMDSQSTAEWEHKAFLFDKEKGLLVIPAYSYSWNSVGGSQRYNGAMVFSVTPASISLRGIVDHSGGTDQQYAPAVERSLYIDDLLYTKSPSLLRINRLSDLSSVKNVTLSATSAGPYAVY